MQCEVNVFHFLQAGTLYRTRGCGATTVQSSLPETRSVQLVHYIRINAACSMTAVRTTISTASVVLHLIYSEQQQSEKLSSDGHIPIVLLSIVAELWKEE